MEISVRDLKGRLSEALRRVAAGEEMVVTSRGKAVARLLPPRARKRALPEGAEAIARFRGQPWVRAGSGERPPLPRPLLRIGKGSKTLAQIVSEQRG